MSNDAKILAKVLVGGAIATLFTCISMVVLTIY